MSRTAIQDQMGPNLCFGCGPDNADGLQIKSYWTDELEAECRFQPQPQHAAGPPHVLNGGIIATLLDCHGICTACGHAYRREGREIGSDPHLWFATGSIRIAYLRPTPIDQEAALYSRIRESTPKKIVVDVWLEAGGKRCAEAEVVAVLVPTEWFEGPRHG